MPLGSFLKLVEIQTKLASMVPFILGTLYAVYRFQKFNSVNFILMLLSLLAFDMATTAINNYLDYKRAKKTYGYNYESHNAIVRDNLKESSVIAVILTLLLFASIMGILLFLNTTVLVLLIGMISFMVGILYSFGPIPISRTPFGELFSGFFMGFVIIFLSVYIHSHQQAIIFLAYRDGWLQINANLVELLYIFLLSFSSMAGIANIMLANNICDIEDDMENHRYTLPIYIGRKNALIVFEGLYYAAFAALLVLVLLRITPLVSLLTLLTFIPVYRNIRLFSQKQSKQETFVTAVKNFAVINIVQAITLGIGVILRAV